MCGYNGIYSTVFSRTFCYAHKFCIHSYLYDMHAVYVACYFCIHTAVPMSSGKYI